jgi:hypothetical protein
MATVAITIPQRPQYNNAYWVLQRRFESGGPYLLDVTEAQLAELKADPVLTLIEDTAAVLSIDAARPAPAAAAPDVPKTKPLKR